MQAIKMEGLTKYYGRTCGIRDVSLAIDEGDFFGFLGPNGAGKSTTIRTLLGLIRATGGCAEIFGRDVIKEKTAVLSDIGYLPSETMFYHGMRVRDILKLSADLRKRDCAAEAKRLCERLELDPDKRIDELSLGNRKKAGIVCAMQHMPRLYILDEPTSGLDPLMQREFYALLQERNTEGATVFLSCHVLSEVQRYCRHAAIIREGRILVNGSVEQLGHTGAKRVTLQGVDHAPELSEIRDIKAASDGISFLYGGDIKVLARVLSEMPVTDFTVAEPDLEEVFMHYYTGEEYSHDDLEA